MPFLCIIFVFKDYLLSIKCFTCHAESLDECNKSGAVVQCGSSELMCTVEIRRRKGDVTNVQTGCKQPEACLNNKVSLKYIDFFMTLRSKENLLIMVIIVIPLI